MQNSPIGEPNFNTSRQEEDQDEFVFNPRENSRMNESQLPEENQPDNAYNDKRYPNDNMSSNQPFERENPFLNNHREDGNTSLQAPPNNNESEKNINERQSLLKPQQPLSQPKPPAAKKPDLRQQQQQFKDENQAVLKWRNINLILITLNVFLTVIFLQILAQGEDSSPLIDQFPQTNGIAIDSSASIVYFVLSIFTLIVLFFQYEIVNYGYKNVVAAWRVIAPLYGLVLIALGIALLVLEIPTLQSTADKNWANMSFNQKLFFEDSKANLVEKRRLNVILFGAFAFVIGAMFLAMAGTLSMLYKEMAIKWLPPMVSRLPEKAEHEKVDFIFYCIRDEDHDDPNQANLFPGIQRGDQEEEDESQDEFEEDDRDDSSLVQKDQQLEEQRMQMQFGAAPGQQAYDQYANYPNTGMVGGNDPGNFGPGFSTNFNQNRAGMGFQGGY